VLTAPLRNNASSHCGSPDFAPSVAFWVDHDLFHCRKLTQKVTKRRITRVDGKNPLGDTAWLTETG
jgi:hypothetical protein